MVDKWSAALAHLEAAEQLLRGERYGSYVDVESAPEALDVLIDALQMKIWEDAGKPGTCPNAPGARR